MTNDELQHLLYDVHAWLLEETGCKVPPQWNGEVCLSSVTELRAAKLKYLMQWGYLPVEEARRLDREHSE